MTWGNLFRGMLTFCVFSVFVISSGCAKPPTKELANAKLAINAAKQAEADVYSPLDYRSAEDYLDQARRMLEKKKYKEAREMAVASKNKAVKAKNEAIQAKIQAKTEAEQKISELRTAIKAADAAGAAKYNQVGLLSVKKILEDAENEYNFDRYAAAMEKAESGISQAYNLEASSKTAEESAQAAASRMREEENAKNERMRKLREEEANRKRENERAQFQRKVSKTKRHIVQKGESLWVISRDIDIYGDPYQWPLIYKSNRSQINDPDLIYPGQNFVVPRDVSDWGVRTAIRYAKHRGPWSLFDGK